MEQLIFVMKRGTGKSLLVSAGIVTALGVYFFFDPAAAGFFPPCPVKLLAGLECPGCGSQRALHALLHLDITEAFRLNPLALAAMPFLAYDRLTGKGPLRHRFAPWMVFTVVAGYWIIRNLPFYPY